MTWCRVFCPRALRRIAIAACLVLVAHRQTASAQVPSLIDLSAQYAPPARDDSSSTQAQFSSYQLNINVPIPLSPQRFLILGGGYHADTIASTSGSMSVWDQRTFHAAELSALFIQMLPDHWMIMTRVAGGLAGDFDAVDRHMFGYSVTALAIRPMSERLTLGGGALVAAGFGHFLPLPAIMVNWRPTDNVLVETFLPAFVNVRYSAGSRFEIGARAEVTGHSYGVRDPHVAGRASCMTSDTMPTGGDPTAQPDTCLDHVSYTVGSAGLVAGVRLTSTLWLTAFGGVSFYRHFDEQDVSGDTIPGGATALPAAVFFRTNLTWRIPHS